MRVIPNLFSSCAIVAIMTIQPAGAACIMPPVSAEELDSFKSDPGALLKRFPLASGAMASAIRELAASDAGVLGAIASLVEDATDAQKSAIAAGLAQAALACRAQDPALALQIQEAVAGIDNDSVNSQFAAITGDIKTAATGAGGAGGGGGGGAAGASGEAGQTGGSNSGSNVSVGRSTPTGPSSFSISASSASQTGTTAQTLGAAISVVSASE